MEGKKLRFVIVLVPCSLRKDTDGNSGFHFVNGGEDRLQSLFDILPVQKQTVEISHPVGKQGIFRHFLFGHIAGAARAAHIGEKNVKIAPVVADVQDRGIGGNVFFADHSHLRTCDPQDETEYALDDPQRTDVLRHGRKLPDDPFHQQNGDGKNQVSHHGDHNK